MSAPSFHVETLGVAHRERLPALFERADCACYCRYWHFAGTSNDWALRMATAPEQNRRALEAAIDAGSLEASGLVALADAGGEVVGWMKLAPAASLPKLYAQRLYRGLPCFEGGREHVWAIGCLLVDPGWRRAGVARALIGAGVELARARGAAAIEAFPRRADLLRPDEMWTGPFSALAEHGFEIVHDFRPYPVLRRKLG